MTPKEIIGESAYNALYEAGYHIKKLPPTSLGKKGIKDTGGRLLVEASRCLKQAEECLKRGNQLWGHWYADEGKQLMDEVERLGVQ